MFQTVAQLSLFKEHEAGRDQCTEFSNGIELDKPTTKMGGEPISSAKG